MQTPLRIDVRCHVDRHCTFGWVSICIVIKLNTPIVNKVIKLLNSNNSQFVAQITWNRNLFVEKFIGKKIHIQAFVRIPRSNNIAT